MKKLRLVLICLLLLAVALSFTACGCGFSKSDKKKTSATTTEPTYLTVIGDGETDYKIVFAQKSDFTGLSGITTDLRSLAASALGVNGMPFGNDSAAAVAHEILIGDTNRPETAAVATRLAETAGQDYIQFVIAEVNGKIVLYSDSPLAYGQYNYLYRYFAATYMNAETKTLMVAEGLFDRQTVTREAHEAYVKQLEDEAKAREEAEKQKKCDELMVKIKDFRLADFGRINKLVSLYEKPPVYPAESHPRILVTPETLPAVKANLTHPENAAAYKRFIDLSEEETDGVLPKETNGKHNYNVNILAIIEAKAFRYLVTGDKLYGYEAILAIKNFIITLSIPEGSDANDTRWFSYTIYTTALVYDWCYDLLTTGDKAHLVAGVQSRLAPNLEMGYPPSGQGAVVGHGTEDSIYRDWLCFAIAAHDDYPDLYEFVAGRLFQDYADAGEFYMQSGSHWQGTNYGATRYYFMLFSETIISKMTNGTYHLFSENLKLPAITFMHYIRPDGQPYRIGDVTGEGGSTFPLRAYYLDAAFAAWLYGDAQLKHFAKDGLAEFSNFTSGSYCLTSVMQLCLNDPTLVVSSDTVDALPLIHYNGSPLGSIIARSAWNDENAVSVYMKIGEAYSANHEHKDAGSFQIFYKGILASESGYYDWYGSTHDYAYNKQTIASNGLLIYNPNYSTANSNTLWQYSGGQSIKPDWYRESMTLSSWLKKGTAEYAKILGHGEGLSDSGEYLYSYLAGDLTNAYDDDTVDEVNRYMISIMTDDPENPMVFLVFDRITAVNASFKKTFLLHTQEQPTVNGTTADIYSKDGGMLRVQSLLTDVSYTVIGGAAGEIVGGVANETDRQFWVGDKNYPLKNQNDTPLTLPENSINEAGWGRIEISPTAAALTDRLLTVMYVTDKDTEESLVLATEIDSDAAVGAEIFGKTVIFPKSVKKHSAAFSFVTNATEGTTEYYITGLTSGQWAVSVNGGEPKMMIADDGGILAFEGEVGTVSLTPAFSTIEYDLGGGRTDSKLPEAYNFGAPPTIPTDLTLLGSEFLGWYTTATFDEGTEFTGISETETRPIKLYAKWKKLFYVLTLEANGGAINETYSSELKIGEAYTLPLDVTMKNATFVGWYDNPNFKGEIVTSIPADREDRDMTFYARYQLIYFNYNFESNVAPTPSGGKVEVSGGVMNWINESGNSNFNFKVEGGYQDASQTISFDIYLPEDGSTVMNFQVRLRPEVRNQFDLIVLTVEDGKFYLGKATGTPILDNAVDHGWHRFTLVLENDNAGLAAGQAVEKGTYTTADKFKSNLAVKAYVNGIYRGETMMRTYLTFGEGYYYTHNGKDPVTNNKKDLTFSSQMTIVQIFSSFTPEEVDCNTTVRFDNFHLADGILTVGGKYFLVYKHGAPENEAYLGNREVIALPNLVGDGVSFEGWYTTPDFKAGTEVTDPETMPAGTVFYAKTTSLYKNLIYELSGGEIEGEYPTKFLPNSGEMTLPTNVTAKNGIFLGWYDNPNFEGEPITAISTETDADITVWARFRMECAATLVATPGVRPIKNTDGTVDYLIGISSNAVAVSGSTSNGGMQGQIKGDAITQVVGKSATHFGLSFRVEKESEAFPHFQIRFRCSDKKQHTPLINFNIDGSIGVFGNVIGSYADGSADLYFDVTVKWASATGTADGKISIAAFVDDVYIGTYEKTVKIAKPSSYLQVIGQVTDNAHINATNGTLLTDGIPNGSETSEEQTTLYSTDAEGHYGIVRFKNVRIYWGAMRDKE